MPKDSSRVGNPLFLKWVKQMHAEKDYKKTGGPPRVTGYENAIRALESCSVTYAHPADMKGKVTGVGPTTIVRLIEKLEEHCEAQGEEMPEPTPKATRAKKTPVKKPKKKKVDSEDEASASEFAGGESDDDFKPGSSSNAKGKKAGGGGRGRKAKKNDSEDDGDSDYRG